MTQYGAIQTASDQTTDKTQIRPFKVNFPEAELADLRRRINATRWPERELVSDASQGVRQSASLRMRFTRLRRLGPKRPIRNSSSLTDTTRAVTLRLGNNQAI